MDKTQWDEWERLYDDYTAARKAYENAQMHFRGAFSELARHYEEGSINKDSLYDEQTAHDKFNAARDAMRAFMEANVNA